MKNWNFKEYAIWWFKNIKEEELKAKGAMPKTISTYFASLKHAVGVIGHIPMKELCKTDMKKMIQSLSDRFSARSIEKIYDISMNVHNDYCSRYNIIPMLRISDFQTNKDANKTFSRSKRELTFKECERIAEAAIEKYPTGTPINRLGYAIVVLAYGDFQNAEELLGLKWSDIDMYENTITIQRKAIEQPLSGGGYEMMLKALPEPRVVKFSEKVKDALIELYKITGNCEFVMTTEKNKIMLANAFGKLYRGAFKRAGYNREDYVNASIGTFCRISPDAIQCHNKNESAFSNALKGSKVYLKTQGFISDSEE